MTEVVAVDIGGTHVRFAIARIEGGRVASLGKPYTFETADHASLESAWECFGAQLGQPLPRATGIAIAGPVQGKVLQLTNNPWMIRPALISSKLGVERFVLVNDFAAVAHAVAQLGEDQFIHLCGSERTLPVTGVVSVVGPGTGLGVAQLLRNDGRDTVIATEGGHMDFAPLDALEDRILEHLRRRYRRVSVERLASGQGLTNIYQVLATIDQRDITARGEKALWTAALSGEDSLATTALERFCLIFGAACGDIALAHGASSVVIAGGLGLRLARHLPGSGFRERFTAKGRFERMMDEMPVKLITHPQPGLFGAAAAFAEKYGE